MSNKKPNFSVHTYEIINKEDTYVHWAKGLSMVIIKDGVKIKLNENEVEQLVKSLPRTIGGNY